MNKIINKYQRDGIYKLFQSSLNYIYIKHIRQKSKKIKIIAKYSGLPTVTRIRVLDLFYPFISINKPDAESFSVDALSNHCSSGDDVLIIGGGRGTTAVTAANSVGSTGSVNIYEPLEEYCKDIEKTTSINEVSDITNIKCAIVEEPTDINIDSDAAELIFAEDLPDADIVEIDCEGAELSILKNMGIKPRVLIVEIHHGEYSVSEEEVVAKIKEMGYDIQKRKSGHILAHITATLC